MDRDEIRTMNDTMVGKILAMPAQPPAEDGFALRVVCSRGRGTGTWRRTPLAVVRHRGGSYLVSPQPGRDWVRNLLADGTCTVLAKDSESRSTAVRVEAAEGVPVVGTYLDAMDVPWAKKAFPFDLPAPPDVIERHWDELAVFRLDPA